MAHSNWYSTPGGTSCPAPMTRAALIALRNSGGLSKDCDYVITDHVQGRLVAGTQIHLQAVSANRLSEAVSVLTTYDDEAWQGLYDIDRALVLELHDNRGNVAKGISGTEVSAFDWGNASYTNVVVDNATLTADIGNTAAKANVTVRQNGTLNLTGFLGSINNFVVENFGTANFTRATGTWRMARVSDNSLLNLTDYTGGGDNYYFDIAHGSGVNASNSSSPLVLRTSNLFAMTVSHTGVSTGALTVQLSPALHSSTITHSPGAGAMTLTRVSMEELGAVTCAVGTLAISQTTIGKSASVLQQTAAGSISLTGSTIEGSSTLVNRGSGTLTATRLRLEQASTVQLDTGTTIGMALTDATVTSNSVVGTVGAAVAGSFAITASVVASGSFVYKRAAHTGNLSVNQSHLSGSSGIDATSGPRGYAFTRLTASEVSRLNLTGTGTATDTFADISMSHRGGVTVSCSGAANSVLYCAISGLSGTLSLTGTTGGQAINRCKAVDGTIRFNNSTANASLTLSSARDNGLIAIDNLTVAKSVQYIDVENLSQFVINAPTGGGTVQAVKVSRGSTFTSTGAAAGAIEAIVSGGALIHNGGSLTDVTKTMRGNLTTGAFNHTRIARHATGNKTLTANNTDRADYLGLTSTAPLV